jgi:hypothetical protein
VRSSSGANDLRFRLSSCLQALVSDCHGTPHSLAFVVQASSNVVPPGDVVIEALRQLFAPTPVPAIVHVVSNSLIFDKEGPDGRLVGFSEPILHVFNKSAATIPQGGPLAMELHRRPNVIVVGDSTGDATMADGGGHETVLKLGLLNHDIEVRGLCL